MSIKNTYKHTTSTSTYPELGDNERYGKHHISEITTFGGGIWNDTLFKAAVHGASVKDRHVPHIHIYYGLETDYNNPAFNFEISIVDIVSKDEITLVYQKDAVHNVLNTDSESCSWDGYSKLLEGFRDFLFQKPVDIRDSGFQDYLDKAIHFWNTETLVNYEALERNPMKEYMEEHNISVLPKYAPYFEN